MSADKIKQIVSGGFDVRGARHSRIRGSGSTRPEGQAEIVAAVVAVYTIVHGVVDYVHTKGELDDSEDHHCSGSLSSLGYSWPGSPFRSRSRAQGGDAVYPLTADFEIPLARAVHGTQRAPGCRFGPADRPA